MAITLDQKYLEGYIDDAEITALAPRVETAHDELENGTGAGSDYTGWLHLPSAIDDAFVDDIVALGKEVRGRSDCLISIGIGGSYLGIRSTLDFLRDSAQIPVYFAGSNMSADYLYDLLDKVKDKDVTVVMISKSGTTTEPALAFRVIRKFLTDKYGHDGLNERIICVTDAQKGALRRIADENGFRSFIIPDDVGGRFSVLTPVGLVPLAIAGVDVHALIKGARQGEQEYGVKDLRKNTAYQYAAARHLLYTKGRQIEVLSSFYDNMITVNEWWKQLFGESEGKDGGGIFPASMIFSTDLHSMGQWMQDGIRNVFETFVQISSSRHSIMIPADEEDLDGFNCVAGKDLDYVNTQAYEATAEAHFEGGVPNMTLTMEQADAVHLGQLYYFFERAVAVSGYLSGVNPFNQPGVEAYKKKMFERIGKE